MGHQISRTKVSDAEIKAVKLGCHDFHDASGEVAERVAKIADGKLTIGTAHGLRTVYRLRNGGEQQARILVKHGLAPGAKLFSPPAGTEERMSAGSALVPATVSAHDTKELVVDERSEEIAAADWFGEAAGFALRSYLADPSSDREVVRKLSSAWPLREEALAKMRERDHLRQQQFDLKQETEEIRHNLKAAGGGTGDDLRAKLGGRLTHALGQIAEDDKKIVALDADIGRASDAFKALVQDIRTTP